MSRPLDTDTISELDDAIQRGVASNEAFCYMSIAGYLILIPKAGQGQVRRFRLEEI